MEVPSKADWEETWKQLDGPSAFRHFFGKTLTEALKLFQHCALVYQEDLVYMSEKPFKYYVRAYVHYLASERSRGDADAANCFLGLVEIRLRDHPEWLDPSWGQIEPVLRKIAEKQVNFFDAEPSIYGDFSTKVDSLLNKRSNVQEFAGGNSGLHH